MAAHTRAKGAPARKTHRVRRFVISGLAVVVIAAGAVAATAVIKSHRAASAAQAPSSVKLAVLQTSPAAGAQSISPATPISVSFNTPLDASSPLPTLVPAIPGAWEALSPTTLTFVAKQALVPSTTERIVIPGGMNGVVASNGTHLTSTVTVPYSIAPGTTLRLEQLLAELNYLPVSFTPAKPISSIQALAAAQPGTFSWRFANTPSSLSSLWVVGQSNTILQGAVMNFEHQHGLTTDGLAGPQVWQLLLHDATVNRMDALSYDYVYVQQRSPETLFLYVNGKVIYTTAVNTGISAAPTTVGTAPVYLRFTSTTMKGTNPDGSTYDDAGIPWVSYFRGGEALHGYIRYSYGFPQSLGCVEMPYAHAGVVWPYTPIGTLVTVGAL